MNQASDNPLTLMQTKALAMYHAGLTQQQIAAMFGVTRGAISQRIRRANDRLRRAGLITIERPAGKQKASLTLSPELAEML